MPDAPSISATPDGSPRALQTSTTPSSLRSRTMSRTNSRSELPFLQSIATVDRRSSSMSEASRNAVERVLAEDRPSLPEPNDPSRCPLFCCFYAEFDNVVGPKVCFQSPERFMDQDINISTEEVHGILAEAFKGIMEEESAKTDAQHENVGENTQQDQKPVAATSEIAPDEHEVGGDQNFPTKLDDVSHSIFDATSEYAITGNELAGKMICLSTHRIHILTRPTAIANERYERNSLLFCLGFVLRREEDPRPFRPLLSKWAVALRSMEVESQFLTEPTLRPKLQGFLKRLLVSLNSKRKECNLLLDSANSLNLKLFRPPKPPASPVPDHKVPVLLRTDCFQLFDWELAINWVVLHIDGAKHARWISTQSDVDMEMVRACLRVLKHHKVIALVDMFFYSNRYECTEKAAAMWAGKEPKLLQDALEYVAKHRHTDGALSDSTHSGVTNLAATRHDRPSSPASSFSASFPAPSSSQIGSARGLSPKYNSLTGTQDVSGLSGREQAKMKAALAELYCSCNRNMSFGDLWLSKITEAALTKANAVTTTRKNGVNVEGERTGRSLPEGFPEINPLLNMKESSDTMKSAPDAVHWKDIFESIDHRRFATFGVIHGLLRRVHNYPSVYDTSILHKNESQEQSVSPEFGGHELIRTASFRDESVGQSFPVSPGKRRGSSGPSCSSSESDGEDLNDLVREIMSKMDATRSDDELVCMFERPFEELLTLIKTVSGKDVCSIYSSSELERE